MSNKEEVNLAVWKFQFEITDTFTIDMPDGARVLHVGLQGDTPTIWCLVNPEAGPCPVAFILRGTGQPFEESLARACVHVGTFQMAGGQLVFHLFTENG